MALAFFGFGFLRVWSSRGGFRVWDLTTGRSISIWVSGCKIQDTLKGLEGLVFRV